MPTACSCVYMHSQTDRQSYIHTHIHIYAINIHAIASYGGLARFKDTERIKKVNATTLVSAGGEYSDFQFICDLLEENSEADFCFDDGHTLSGKEVWSYLSRVLYNRRSKVNPLWNEVVTASVDNGQSFLGLVDLYGTHYEADIAATGFGSYMATPLLRKHWKADLTEQEAKKLLEDSMRVLFYRHCRTINKFQIAKVTAEGVEISDPYSLDTYWEHKRFVDPLTQQ